MRSRYIYEREEVEINTLSFIIKYLTYRLVHFKAEIYRNMIFAKFSKPTVHVIKSFQLHYRKCSHLQRIRLIVTAALLLKVLEELQTFTVTKLTSAC